MREARVIGHLGHGGPGHAFANEVEIRVDNDHFVASRRARRPSGPVASETRRLPVGSTGADWRRGWGGGQTTHDDP